VGEWESGRGGEARRCYTSSQTVQISESIMFLVISWSFWRACSSFTSFLLRMARTNSHIAFEKNKKIQSAKPKSKIYIYYLVDGATVGVCLEEGDLETVCEGLTFLIRDNSRLVFFSRNVLQSKC